MSIIEEVKMVKKIKIIAMLTISIGIFVLTNCTAKKDTSSKEQPIETVNVINRELVKESKDGNCSLKIFYPQIEGLSNVAVEKKINAELINKFISKDHVYDIENCDPEARYKIEITYSTKLNKNNILSIMIKHYMVTPGGGSTLLEGFTVGVKNGELYKYEDLFKPDTNYILKINKIVWGYIEEDEPGFKTRMNTTKYEFYITENELVILPSVSPKMAGEVPINLSKITDIINPEGPLNSLMKR
jgi:hypothetical protein